MGQYPDIYVLRHGQTTWNLAGRYQGRLESPLTPLGQQQARDQGRILQNAGLTTSRIACFTSPQDRSVKTAALALAHLGVTVRPDPRLQEIAFGDWQGLTDAEIDSGWPGLRCDGPDKSWYFNAPNCETYPRMTNRLRAFLDGLRGPTVVVTHGFSSIILRGLWLGLDKGAALVLPHRQGCVYHLQNGQEICLTH